MSADQTTDRGRPQVTPAALARLRGTPTHEPGTAGAAQRQTAGQDDSTADGDRTQRTAAADQNSTTTDPAGTADQNSTTTEPAGTADQNSSTTDRPGTRDQNSTADQNSTTTDLPGTAGAGDQNSTEQDSTDADSTTHPDSATTEPVAESDARLQPAPPEQRSPDVVEEAPGRPAASSGTQSTTEQPGLGAQAMTLPDGRFLNRELSWLEFNSRVLALAEDPGLPLLERVKFLAIFSSNLDEFYMVRVAGLKRRRKTGLSVVSADGLSPREQLARISSRTHELIQRQSACYTNDVGPALTATGITLADSFEALDAADRDKLHVYFREQVFPVLTPLAVDPAHPFPYISGLSLNLAVTVREPGTESERFARIKVPNNVPRFVTVSEDESGTLLLPLEDLIAAHLPQLFPGMEVVDHSLFRVTRNADFEVEEDRDEDLLQALERELARRRFGPPVRLEVAESMDPTVLSLLVGEFDVSQDDVQYVSGLMDMSSLWAVYGLDRGDLKDRPFVPATHPRLVEGETPRSVFATLREGDVLVHHPYDSFATSVQRFIEQAAADPNVLAIKQTLYRTSGDSPIVDALIDAAEAGKQVVVLVEIKARFDEQTNITWARSLERVGVHVIYGLVGLKTHCKVAQVVRQEGDRIRRYAHIGTGNYNAKTARLYEDLGLLTADDGIGADLTDLFNTLTGYSRRTHYRSLLVAPHGIRTGLVERIEREAAHARAGRPAHLRLKVNSLVDEQVIDALYRASCDGVRIELFVRAICTIKPGVPGLSENISVRSVVGRFLEHSRISYFANDGDPEFWLGSSDLMHRNLDRRVEVLVQVTDETAKSQLQSIFDLAMAPTTNVWELDGDARWQHRTTSPDGRPLDDYQGQLMLRHTDRPE